MKLLLLYDELAAVGKEPVTAVTLTLLLAAVLASVQVLVVGSASVSGSSTGRLRNSGVYGAGASARRYRAYSPADYDDIAGFGAGSAGAGAAANSETQGPIDTFLAFVSPNDKAAESTRPTPYFSSHFSLQNDNTQNGASESVSSQWQRPNQAGAAGAREWPLRHSEAAADTWMVGPHGRGRTRRRKVRRRKMTTTTSSTTAIPDPIYLMAPWSRPTTPSPSPVRHYRAHQSQSNAFIPLDDYDDYEGYANNVLRRSPTTDAPAPSTTRGAFSGSTAHSTTAAPTTPPGAHSSPSNDPKQQLIKQVLYLKKNYTGSGRRKPTDDLGAEDYQGNGNSGSGEDEPPLWRVMRIETSMTYTDSTPNLQDLVLTTPFEAEPDDDLRPFKQGQGHTFTMVGTPKYIDLQSDETYNPYANGTPITDSGGDTVDLHAILHPIFSDDTDLTKPVHSKLPENKTETINSTLSEEVKRTPIAVEVKKNRAKLKKKHPLIWNQDSRISSDEGQPGLIGQLVEYDYGLGDEVVGPAAPPLPRPPLPPGTSTTPTTTTPKPIPNYVTTQRIRRTSTTRRTPTTTIGAPPPTPKASTRSTPAAPSSSSANPATRTSTFSTTTPRPAYSSRITTRRNPATTPSFVTPPESTRAPPKATAPTRQPVTESPSPYSGTHPTTITSAPPPPASHSHYLSPTLQAVSTENPFLTLEQTTNSLNDLVQLLSLLGGQNTNLQVQQGPPKPPDYTSTTRTVGPNAQPGDTTADAGQEGLGHVLNGNSPFGLGGGGSSSELQSQLSLLETLLGGANNAASSNSQQTLNPLNQFLLPSASPNLFYTPAPPITTTTEPPTIRTTPLTTAATSTTPLQPIPPTEASPINSPAPPFLANSGLSDSELKALVQLLGAGDDQNLGGSPVITQSPANNIQEIVEQLTLSSTSTTPAAPAAPPAPTPPSITAALNNMMAVLANPFGANTRTPASPAIAPPLSNSLFQPVTDGAQPISAPLAPQATSPPAADNILTQLLQLGNSLGSNTQNTRQVVAPPPAPTTQSPLLNPFSWLTNLAQPTTASPFSSLFDLNNLFRNTGAAQQQQQQQTPPLMTNFLNPFGSPQAAASSITNPNTNSFSNLFNFNAFAPPPQSTTRRPITNGPYWWLDLNTFFGPPEGIRPKLGTREYFIKV